MLRTGRRSQNSPTIRCIDRPGGALTKCYFGCSESLDTVSYGEVNRESLALQKNNLNNLARLMDTNLSFIYYFSDHWELDMQCAGVGC